MDQFEIDLQNFCTRETAVETSQSKQSNDSKYTLSCKFNESRNILELSIPSDSKTTFEHQVQDTGSKDFQIVKQTILNLESNTFIIIKESFLGNKEWIKYLWS